MASELIAEAITDYFGERCIYYAEGCPTCEAWAEYDRWNTRPAPADTDTVSKDGTDGLVTVASLRENGELIKANEIWAYDNTKPLVTRSQAEELLAAERADKRIWMEKAAIEAERVEHLEADNAAQAARIKELEADVKREAQSSTHNAQDCLDEQLRAEALEAKLAAAHEALTEIASFTQTTDLLWWQERARAALLERE